MRLVISISSLIVIVIVLAGIWFFYVSVPGRDALVLRYMSLPPCIFDSAASEIRPPDGFSSCRFIDNKLAWTGEINGIWHVMRDVEGPPINMGRLGPGESKSIYLFR